MTNKHMKFNTKDLEKKKRKKLFVHMYLNNLEIVGM